MENQSGGAILVIFSITSQIKLPAPLMKYCHNVLIYNCLTCYAIRLNLKKNRRIYDEWKLF